MDCDAFVKAGAALETAAPSGSNTERVEAAANAAGKASTSGLVQAITQTGGSFEYAYDANGNITTVKQDGVTTTYTYDALGQLTRVDDGLENATWLYTYDQGGNILTKKKFARGVTSGTPAETKTFSYANAKLAGSTDRGERRGHYLRRHRQSPERRRMGLHLAEWPPTAKNAEVR